MCLIKCGEQVVATKLVSTVASSSKNPDVDLYVPGTVTLNNIYSDFTVTFEVYCLQAHEECLPHEVKYHINKKVSVFFTFLYFTMFNQEIKLLFYSSIYQFLSTVQVLDTSFDKKFRIFWSYRNLATDQKCS